jgi:hypothetical protein
MFDFLVSIYDHEKIIKPDRIPIFINIVYTLTPLTEFRKDFLIRVVF